MLLADADPRAAGVHAAALAAVGCGVTRAGSGVEALGLLQTGVPFDLLVADLALPVLDGVGLIRRLRQLHPWCPVVVAASASPPGGIRGLHRRGEGPLLVFEKPVAPARLAAAAALVTCRAARPAVGRCPLAAAGAR